MLDNAEGRAGGSGACCVQFAGVHGVDTIHGIHVSWQGPLHASPTGTMTEECTAFKPAGDAQLWS